VECINEWSLRKVMGLGVFAVLVVVVAEVVVVAA
jgi:hypothetical protein